MQPPPRRAPFRIWCYPLRVKILQNLSMILFLAALLLGGCATQAVHDREGQPSTGRKPLRDGLMSVNH